MCKHCAVEEDVRALDEKGRARFFTEGEAETKEPDLSTPGLARWRDSARRTLYCPRCGVEEMVDKA